MSEAQLYPLFLKLSGRGVVVVGGGRVAASRLPPLLAAGARVTVIAPEIDPDILASDATSVARGFEPGDLDGAWLVVAAATPAVNREVAAAAAERRLFANVVDEADTATAYTAGVLRRAGVTIALSTAGRAPALAGLLREALEAVLPEELETWVARADELRRRHRAEGVPMQRRRPLLLSALNRIYEGRELQVD